MGLYGPTTVKSLDKGNGCFSYYTKQVGSVEIPAPRAEALGLIYMYRSICPSGRKQDGAGRRRKKENRKKEMSAGTVKEY